MKDKNGYELREGTPVRLTQTQADYLQPTRKYHIAEVNGEMVLAIPLEELRTSETHFAVETCR